MAKSILAYWKDSCQLIGKDSGKMFFLATANNFITSFSLHGGTLIITGILFVAAFFAAQLGMSSQLWHYTFASNTIKSPLWFHLITQSSLNSTYFFDVLLVLIITMIAMRRSTIERKDTRYLVSTLVRYLPFFIIAQDYIILMPFFAFIFMDMDNTIFSFFKAFVASLKLFFYHLPVVLSLGLSYVLLMWLGKGLYVGATWCNIPPLLGAVVLPVLWLVFVLGLHFSACAIYYIKVKHTDRELLFGKE